MRISEKEQDTSIPTNFVTHQQTYLEVFLHEDDGIEESEVPFCCSIQHIHTHARAQAPHTLQHTHSHTPFNTHMNTHTCTVTPALMRSCIQFASTGAMQRPRSDSPLHFCF